MPRKKTIEVRFEKREEFLDHFKWKERNGIFFIETNTPLGLGDAVRVEVSFPSESCSFGINGKVISRRLARPGKSSAGSDVEIEFPGHESRTLKMILDHAHGKLVQFVKRDSRRMPCSFVVAYRRDEDFVREFASDISEGGTFIQTDKIYPPGTEVECKLKPPGYILGVKIKGRVVWARHQRQPTGMGIAFKFESERQRKKFMGLIKKLLADDRGRYYQERPETVKKSQEAEEEEESYRLWAYANLEKGEQALRNGQFDEAIHHYQEAVRLFPNDPTYHLRVGLAIYLKACATTPKDQPLPDTIRQPFLKALALNPKYDEPRVHLGYIALRNGHHARALKEFEGALECNPDNETARIEVNVLKKRLDPKLQRKP